MKEGVQNRETARERYPSPALVGKKRLRVLVAVAGSLLAADLALSLVLLRDGTLLGRPLPPFGAITHPRQWDSLDRMSRPSDGIGVFDADLGWTWQPSTVSPDGLSRTNALGARGPREYEPAPPPDKTRLACFGDSFVFGDEIPDETMTFEYILEEIAPRYEALNFGVSGYGTDQALLRYRKVGRSLGAEVVVIGLMLENIGRNVNRYRPLWYMSSGFCNTKPRFVLDGRGELELVPQPYASRAELRAAILDGSVLDAIAEHEYWLGRPRVPTGKLSALVRCAAGFLAYRERTPARLWRDEAGEPFRVTLALLERFQREALADGARLAPILVFASKEDMLEYAIPGNPYWTGFYAELERRELPYVDTIAPLAARARELETEGSKAALFYGGHLSGVGNAVVAHELRAWLADRLD